MGDGSFSIGPVELGVISAIVGFIFKQLLKSKDDQIASEREDKIAYRNALLAQLKIAGKSANVADAATSALAREKGLDDG